MTLQVNDKVWLIVKEHETIGGYTTSEIVCREEAFADSCRDEGWTVYELQVTDVRGPKKEDT